MAKKILIIGAGMAGLAAGIHACHNGYEADIFELHNAPGGLCAAWNRNGYTFDGCIQRLVGTKPDSQFNRLWRELGALEDTKIINHEIFMTIETGEGNIVSIYSDLDRLREHLLEIAPQDAPEIRALVEAARAIANQELPLEKPGDMLRFWDVPLMMFRTMPLFKYYGRYSQVTIADYLKTLKTPLLKEALSRIMPDQYSMIGLISVLASLHSGDAGFPEGGSLPFARSLEKRLLELGGRFHYGSRVKQILVNDGTAYGLLLEEGGEVAGDYIIAASDLHSTVCDLLGGRYNTPLIKDSFSRLPYFTSAQVTLGVNCDLTAEAKKVSLKLDNPLDLGAGPHHDVYLTNYSFDSTLAPPGKSVVAATVYSAYDYWESASRNKELYREKKERLAEKLVTAAQKRYPQIRHKIEEVDVVTPFTYNRYTAVWKGAYMGWIAPPSAGRFNIPRKLPGLDSLLLAGQWIAPPAGLSGSMLTGRHAIQVICHKDQKPFIRSK